MFKMRQLGYATWRINEIKRQVRDGVSHDNNIFQNRDMFVSLNFNIFDFFGADFRYLCSL